MIKRIAATRLAYLAKKFKAVAINGPRQSGKTTLVKMLFPKKPYVTLENPEARRAALTDPNGFLAAYPKGAILDEAQRAPELFSYIQEILDDSKQPGLFVFTGSNNFLLQESISQSLAGRIAYLTLLPFSVNELKETKSLPKSDANLMLKGFYPPIYDQNLGPQDWCHDYIRTYIEKDVRQIKNISNLLVFEKFLALLAGRCGQELNLLNLGNEAGIDHKTCQSWIGILERSFIVFLLRPHSRNFNKTIVKRPKLYFYDIALVCSLLRITELSHIGTHPLKGALFENMVVSELVKQRANAGKANNLFYWRDKTGHEIDVVVDVAGKLLPIEIKSGQTINPDFFRNLNYWKKLSGVKKSVLLYGGLRKEKRSDGTDVMGWKDYL